jgi:3-deoxy-D-manno-octulosonate 8-phosphate phosphatase (KDO 8-P phosphatase)
MFEGIGGEFRLPVERLAEALANVRVFLFDWDGVFNNGIKMGDHGSPFGEDDSMGVNLLRLSYWMKHGKMPITGILTGAANEGAEYLAKREGFESCIRGFTNKGEAFHNFCNTMQVNVSEVAFVFDDVLDLPVAQQAAVRFCVTRKSSPLFTEFVKAQGLCDYFTGSAGGYGAVRECSELMIALTGDHEAAVKVRMEYGVQYQEYLALRKAVRTEVIKP